VLAAGLLVIKLAPVLGVTALTSLVAPTAWTSLATLATAYWMPLALGTAAVVSGAFKLESKLFSALFGAASKATNWGVMRQHGEAVGFIQALDKTGLKFAEVKQLIEDRAGNEAGREAVQALVMAVLGMDQEAWDKVETRYNQLTELSKFAGATEMPEFVKNLTIDTLASQDEVEAVLDTPKVGGRLKAAAALIPDFFKDADVQTYMTIARTNENVWNKKVSSMQALQKSGRATDASYRLADVLEADFDAGRFGFAKALESVADGQLTESDVARLAETYGLDKHQALQQAFQARSEKILDAQMSFTFDGKKNKAPIANILRYFGSAQMQGEVDPGVMKAVQKLMSDKNASWEKMTWMRMAMNPALGGMRPSAQAPPAYRTQQQRRSERLAQASEELRGLSRETMTQDDMQRLLDSFEQALSAFTAPAAGLPALVTDLLNQPANNRAQHFQTQISDVVEGKAEDVLITAMTKYNDSRRVQRFDGLTRDNLSEISTQKLFESMDQALTTAGAPVEGRAVLVSNLLSQPEGRKVDYLKSELPNLSIDEIQNVVDSAMASFDKTQRTKYAEIEVPTLRQRMEDRRLQGITMPRTAAVQMGAVQVVEPETPSLTPEEELPAQTGRAPPVKGGSQTGVTPVPSKGGEQGGDVADRLASSVRRALEPWFGMNVREFRSAARLEGGNLIVNQDKVEVLAAAYSAELSWYMGRNVKVTKEDVTRWGIYHERVHRALHDGGFSPAAAMTVFEHTFRAAGLDFAAVREAFLTEYGDGSANGGFADGELAEEMVAKFFNYIFAGREANFFGREGGRPALLSRQQTDAYRRAVREIVSSLQGAGSVLASHLAPQPAGLAYTATHQAAMTRALEAALARPEPVVPEFGLAMAGALAYFPTMQVKNLILRSIENNFSKMSGRQVYDLVAANVQQILSVRRANGVEDAGVMVTEFDGSRGRVSGVRPVNSLHSDSASRAGGAHLQEIFTRGAKSRVEAIAAGSMVAVHKDIIENRNREFLIHTHSKGVLPTVQDALTMVENGQTIGVIAAEEGNEFAVFEVVPVDKDYAGETTVRIWHHKDGVLVNRDGLATTEAYTKRLSEMIGEEMLVGGRLVIDGQTGAPYSALIWKILSDKESLSGLAQERGQPLSQMLRELVQKESAIRGNLGTQPSPAGFVRQVVLHYYYFNADPITLAQEVNQMFFDHETMRVLKTLHLEPESKPTEAELLAELQRIEDLREPVLNFGVKDSTVLRGALEDLLRSGVLQYTTLFPEGGLSEALKYLRGESARVSPAVQSSIDQALELLNKQLAAGSAARNQADELDSLRASDASVAWLAVIRSMINESNETPMKARARQTTLGRISVKWIASDADRAGALSDGRLVQDLGHSFIVASEVAGRARETRSYSIVINAERLLEEAKGGNLRAELVSVLFHEMAHVGIFDTMAALPEVSDLSQAASEALATAVVRRTVARLAKSVPQMGFIGDLTQQKFLKYLYGNKRFELMPAWKLEEAILGRIENLPAEQRHQMRAALFRLTGSGTFVDHVRGIVLRLAKPMTVPEVGLQAGALGVRVTDLESWFTADGRVKSLDAQRQIALWADEHARDLEENGEQKIAYVFLTGKISLSEDRWREVLARHLGARFMEGLVQVLPEADFPAEGGKISLQALHDRLKTQFHGFDLKVRVLTNNLAKWLLGDTPVVPQSKAIETFIEAAQLILIQA
jgi:hypothetical protein